MQDKKVGRIFLWLFFSYGKIKILDLFFFFAKILALHLDPSFKGCLMGLKYI